MPDLPLIMNPVKEIELVSSTSDDALNLVFASDLCPTGRNRALFINGDPDAIYNDLWPILDQADLAIVNLECPLTDSVNPLSKVGPSLRADPQCISGLRAGFQVAALANNHIMDYGAPGLIDTLDACQQSGIRTVGAGQNLAQAQASLFVTVRGTRVAILAITEHEFSIATEHSPGAAPVDPIDNYGQINLARQQADLVIVLLHGGNEHHPLPSPRLVKLCRYLVKVGGDLVICNHTHIASGFEIYQNTPIIYSQGNFIFDRPNRPDYWYRGYLLQAQASKEGIAGLTIVPYVQSREQAGVHRMQQQEAKEFLRELDRLSHTIMDQDKLSHDWRKFCRARRDSYLSHLLGWGRLRQRLARLGIGPSSLPGLDRTNRLLNLFRCESHHDALVQILADVASELQK